MKSSTTARDAIALPKGLHARVQARARRRGISAETYVKETLSHALSAEDGFEREMRAWEEASIADFGVFAKARNA